jgi:hypothetical protein
MDATNNQKFGRSKMRLYTIYNDFIIELANLGRIESVGTGKLRHTTCRICMRLYAIWRGISVVL